jgi:hypothetical protein
VQGQAVRPFISFFTSAEIITLAREAGFKDAQRVSADTLTKRYFAGREDSLRPGTSEEIVVAST